MRTNHSIDKIKGIGIIAVVLGHLLLGSVSDNFLRYVIYSFHMPLFFFISGWLLNTDKLSKITLSEFISKYGKRMLLWWLVAWIIYDGYHIVINRQEFCLLTIPKHIIAPYYHLWFVPGLFTVIAYYWVMLHYTHIKKNQLLIISFCVSFVLLLLMDSKVISDTTIIRRHSLLFLFLGICFKHLNINPLISGRLAFFLYVVFVYVTYMLVPQEASAYNLLYLFVLSVVFAPLIERDSLSPSLMLEWLGRNSLQIYLWHVIPIVVLKHYFEANVFVYYGISVVTLLCLFISLFAFVKKQSSL